MKAKVLFATAFFVLLTTVPSGAVEPLSRCQELEKWASQLEKLPTGYQEFSALSTAERKVVYGRFSSAERAALWQRHWQEALAAGGLTAEQLALVEEAGRLMSAETFAALKPRQGAIYDSAQAAVRDFEARVEKAFPEATADALFYRLGTAPAAGPEAAGLVYYCWCRVGGEDCDAGLRCEAGGCQPRPTGCGIFYEDGCDGRCQYI